MGNFLHETKPHYDFSSVSAPKLCFCFEEPSCMESSANKSANFAHNRIIM